MNKVAVCIPCWNEEITIEKVIHDFQVALPEAIIYVYDNNSTDRTVELARNGGAVVRHEHQQGKGNVVRRMFREVDAECYILVDGDDTYPAEIAPKMVDAVLYSRIDMVVGDRLSSTYASENKRLFHSMGNIFVRMAVNNLFETDIKDIMTGYRALSYQFVKSFPVLSKGFEIETEMSIHAADKNLSVGNVVIDYRDRPSGSISKLNTYSDGFRVLKTISNLFRIYRPMKYFSALALFLTVLTFFFMLPVLLEYTKTGLVERLPTLIVCGFTFIAALLAFFSGIILQTIRNKDLQDFEQHLYQMEKLRKIGEDSIHKYEEIKKIYQGPVDGGGDSAWSNIIRGYTYDNSIQSSNRPNEE